MKYYNVWLEDAQRNIIELFKKKEANELEDWLFEWANLDCGNWWLYGTGAAVFDTFNIPYKATGYIVKFQKI